MKLTLDIRNLDNVGDVAQSDILRITEIIEALVTTGGLTGVKGGKTIIHFDSDGTFQMVQLDYAPWRRRKN